MSSHERQFTKALRREGDKVGKVMHEFKEGELHSGSKKGPEVTNRKQAIAIGLSEARKAKSKALHAKKIGEQLKANHKFDKKDLYRGM